MRAWLRKRRGLVRVIIALILAALLTVYLYWPVYQRVQIGGFTNVDSEIGNLSDLPLGPELREILDRKIELPIDRHRICLKNRNGFHFIHADSNTDVVPFVFYTDDLNKTEYGKKNSLGAMSLKLHYTGSATDEIYRKYGDPVGCIDLVTERMRTYASSTVEYGFVGLAQIQSLDVEGRPSLMLLRSIVGGYYIDTSRTSIYVAARWESLLMTFGSLFVIFYWIAGRAFWKKIYIKAHVLATFYSRTKKVQSQLEPKKTIQH